MDCQNQYSTTMKEWQDVYPIESIETSLQPFWRDTNQQQLVIPPNDLLKRCLMKVWHDSPTAGHPGQDETVRRINREYYWPSVRSWIQEYVKGCATCQQNKNLTHRLKTPLFRIPSDPEAKPFSHITMDLITGLPNSKGYNAILTIVDHGCSRGAIFLPCTTTITGPQIAKLYLDHLYRWFGLPKRVISDRDPHFTSHFGHALTKELGIQQNLSMAFHPQTDGLSERKNQWIEQYLRLVTANQEDWSDWLAVTTLVHNNSANSTTGFAPNELLIGWEPPLSAEQGESTNNSTAEEQASKLQNNRILAIQALNRTAIKDTPTTPRWTIGQKVWLDGKNLPLSYGTIKLVPRRYGPFKITKIVSPVAYHLELPAQWNIHPVFHASLLTPYIETDSHGPNFSRPPPDLIKGENEYEVETIRKHRHFGRNKRLQYLLKWRGYPESDNTWEPVEQLHAPQLLKDYHARHPLETIKATLIQRQKYQLSPTSICLCSCRLSTAHTVSSPPLVAANSSTTPSFFIPRTAFTSVPCAPRGSNIAAASTSTSPTHTSSIPPLSTASDLEKIAHTPRWPLSTSRSPRSPSTLFSPLTTKTRKSSSTPSSVSHHSLPTNFTSSTPDKSATTPLGPTPSNIRPSAKNATVNITPKRCPHYTLTSASNARSVLELSLGGPTSPLMCAHTTRVARADSPAHIANIVPTGATTWSHTSSHAIKLFVPKKNAYHGRALSSQRMDGMRLGPFPHLMTTHSQCSPKPHPLLRLLRLRMS